MAPAPRALARLVLALVAFAGGVAAFRLATGARAGEACHSAIDCARLVGAVCLQDGRAQRYCSRRCSHDHNCRAGWRCLRVPQLGGDPAGEMVCVRPEPAAAPAVDVISSTGP